MQHISALVQHSETAGSIVGAYRLNRTPAREALLPQADYWSQYAVNALRADPVWLRTYDEEATPVKVGASPLAWTIGPTVGPDLLMWDWRLPLLAYLKALAARIIVIRTIDPLVDSAHRAEILGHADFVRMVEMRIRAGFSRSVAVRSLAIWENVAQPCGVVDVQSGEMDANFAWHPHYWWKDPIDVAIRQQTSTLPMTLDEYVTWHDRCVEGRYWRLYDRLGLFSLWTIIADTKAAAAGTTTVVPWKGIEEYKVRLLTESRADAKLRLEAYTEWSEETKAKAAVKMKLDSGSIDT